MRLHSSTPYCPQKPLPLNMTILGFLIWFMAGGLMTPYIVAADAPPTIHHSLAVELEPAGHRLNALDIIHLPTSLLQQGPLSFALNRHLIIDSIELNGEMVQLSKDPEDSSWPKRFTQWIIKYPPANLEPSDDIANLTIAYHGQISDSPKSSDGLRFVRPDKTNGHIGPNGVYLSSETFWYPTWEQHLVSFDVELTLPVDWQVITQGQETNQSATTTHRTSSWSIQAPTEALTLAANHFVVQKKSWRNIQLATYLFPDEASLAQQYLDATGVYLELYTKLLGPYPFSQFAVVENFFPSGLGMPSFTLLGERIVQRGYTQPYSLGHEIVHSWLGNSVFNDFAKGNWVEGLTTYLSNYYYDEATDKDEAALKTRRRMMDEYNLYTTPETDYPIRQFHHKESRIDNAIGYQKTALVFHMLRQKIGDDKFFEGIQKIVQDGTGTYVEWKDLQQMFSQVAEEDLTDFFKQWIEQPGAPSITLNNLSVQPDPLQPGQSILSGTVSQKNPIYKLPLPIHVNLEDASAYSTTLELIHADQPFTVKIPDTPTSVTLDQEHHWLLRLQRDQLPPMLNSWETDARRILVHAKTGSKEEVASLQALMQRIQGQSDIERRQSDSPAISDKASYLIIGTPAMKLLESKTLQRCNKDIQVEADRVTILGETYEEPDMAFLITCPHQNFADHTVSLFFGLTPEAVKPVARLLFFYGWDSYLVYKQGKVVARGMFQPVHSSREFAIPIP